MGYLGREKEDQMQESNPQQNQHSVIERSVTRGWSLLVADLVKQEQVWRNTVKKPQGWSWDLYLYYDNA